MTLMQGSTPLTLVCESHSVVSDSLRPHGLYSPWKSPGQNTGVGRQFPSPGDLPNPGIEPRSPALQVDSLPTELSGSQGFCIGLMLKSPEESFLKTTDAWALPLKSGLIILGEA